MNVQPLSPTAISRQFWQWQEHQIAYTVQGTGQPIVLVHGFGASIGHWRKNIPVLSEAGYRVWAIDLLGFGSSDKSDRTYTVELWQQQLYDFWQEFIGQPAIFVGNSIGGLITLMVLANHPEIAAGGVLLNSAGGLNHRREELPPPLGLVLGTFTKLVGTPILGEALFAFVSQRSRIRATLKQVYGDTSAVTDELVEILHQPAREPGAQKVFAAILNAPPGPRPSELLPKIQKPLLILWGDKDPWTPIQGAKIYQELGPERAQFYSIPGAGHCPHDENPSAVNDYILNWLGSQANNFANCS